MSISIRDVAGALDEEAPKLLGRRIGEIAGREFRDLHRVFSPLDDAAQEARIGVNLISALADVAGMINDNGDGLGTRLNDEAARRTLQHGLIVAGNLLERPIEFLEAMSRAETSEQREVGKGGRA